MKEKKLYSSAIIPDELYVHRDADRKLREVILRMSKPAYISVARQMGKTNLLIQTKRSLENDVNKYVYIDITNKFETAQDCFRYIVNQIINSNVDLKAFQDASISINKLRQITNNNPTEEFQNEIREILKSFTGRIIVFLDEVDDLRKHVFSDDIFGQIRKTYFINETYPVLKRITYVLSGVIDPEKLIKTKENSPFNIAIPIYLEDFTYAEFLELVNKSELILDNEICEYIYEWLKGNPRMSFEILSIIEDLVIKQIQISKEIVDDVINDFYLTNFKNPPIDHIRDLIKHNTEVRKALIKLKNGQTNELSDEIINKFYLFGITSTKVNKENISIKNKVIELSLSDEWLEKIELEKKGYYEYGKEKLKLKEYKEAIKYFKEYLENEPKGKLSNFAKFSIGEAYYLLKEHNLSNQFLLERPINIDFPEFYYQQLFYLGVNCSRLQLFEESVSLFDDVINNYKNHNLIMPSKLNICEIIIKKDSNIESHENTYLEALTYLNEFKDKIEDREYYFKIIYYRLGFILHTNISRKQNALEYFEKALEYANAEDKPILYLLIDSCLESTSERRKNVYTEITRIVIENNIVFSSEDEILTPFNELQLLVILSNLVEFKLNIQFSTFLEYSLNKLYFDNLKEYELLHKVASFSINNNDLRVGEELLNKILLISEIDQKTKKYCHQILGLIYSNKSQILESITNLNQYIKLFDDNSNFNEELQMVDFNSFIHVIDYYRSKKEFEKSFEIATIIERKFNRNLSPDNKANSTVILFYIMDYYSFIGDIQNIKKYGEKTLSIISEIKPVLNELSYVDKKGLDDIERQTLITLNKYKGIRPIEPISIKREPGRNEYVKVKYKNGQENIVKYKKVMEEIKKGDCQIVNFKV